MLSTRCAAAGSRICASVLRPHTHTHTRTLSHTHVEAAVRGAGVACAPIRGYVGEAARASAGSSAAGEHRDTSWFLTLAAAAGLCVYTHTHTHTDAHTAGGKHTAVYTWGSATFGETGHGEEGVGTPVPRVVDALRDKAVVALSSCGSGASAAALTGEGEVYTWGCGRDSRLGHGDNGVANQDVPRRIDGLGVRAVAVAMGELHGMALTAGGELYGWGKRASGHAGARTGAPGKVEGLDGIRIVGVSCGREHTVALDDQGRVYSWGIGASYALGHGDKADAPRPKRIEALAGEKVVGIATGREHTLFLTSNGAVYSCGTDFYGQNGQGFASGYVRSPKLITSLQGKKVTSIAAGEYSSFAVTADGAVYAWGFNKEGALGLGDKTDVGTPRLLETPFDGKVVAVAGGGGHTLFLTDKGVLYAVGRGRSGQLGRGSELESVAAYRTLPVEVTSLSRLPNSHIICIAAGRDHSMALLE